MKDPVLPIKILAVIGIGGVILVFVLERLFGDSDEWPRDWWRKLWHR